VSDLQRSKERVSATLHAALATAKEHSTALAAIAVDETLAWETAAEALLPRLDRGLLGELATAINEPRLHEIVDAHDGALAAANNRREELRDQVLSQADFEAIAEQRKLVDARLLSTRTHIKEMRARPAMLELLEAAGKGARLRDDEQRVLHAYEEHQSAVAILEAEASRLAAITARHHRARRDLANADDDIRGITDRFLLDARRLVVSRLMQPGSPRPHDPSVARALLVAECAAARRTVLTAIYESWVRPNGVALMNLEGEPTQGLSGFELATFAQRADMTCNEATTGLDAYRQRAAAVCSFPPPTSPVSDWWATLVPDVPRPDDSVFVAMGLKPLGHGAAGLGGAPVHAAASDKLAAAWAAVQGTDASAGPPQAWATDPILALPRAPALQAAQANVSLSSGDYEDLIGPGMSSLDLDGIAGASPSTRSPFAVKAPAPVTFQGEAPRHTFSPGSRVGRCVVKGLIGKGGMGEVYRANLEGELGFSRQVVLKRLAAEHIEDDALLASFVREAEIAARIAHPNVVQIFDLQQHGREPFIIMEYLEGLSLQKLATRAWRANIGLEAAVLGRCALDAARGLHAAHSMRGDDGALVGLVHRDVSPDNLFLCSSGFTKLLDFGIARRSDLKTMTGKNELKGKIPYMSPEQILGDPLDARSDLFSLGSSLYYLMTGQRPFVGDSDATTLYAVVNKPHRPLITFRPDAPALAAVVESLLQKQPDDRPVSALEVVERLSRTGVASAEETAAFLRRIEEL
jgi:tRNA A-37 threonylcarbamoyl transferase component Bud32